MSYPVLKTKVVKHTKRRGRGLGSGKGKAAGRGHKGQLARTGKKIKPFFEGGAIELYRRLPKKGGFTRHWIDKPVVINLLVLDSFSSDEIVNLANLKAKNIIPKQSSSFKILGQGDIKKPLTIATSLFSQSAKQKMEAAGCKFVTEEKNDNKDKTVKTVKSKKAKK